MTGSKHLPCHKRYHPNLSRTKSTYFQIITGICGYRQEIFFWCLGRHIELPKKRRCPLASMSFGWISEVETFPDPVAPPVEASKHEVYLNYGIFRQQPQRQEVHYESITGNRFLSAVSQSQLQKKIPSKPVSSSSPVSLPDSANATWPAYLRKRSWSFFFHWRRTSSKPRSGIDIQFWPPSTISASTQPCRLLPIHAIRPLSEKSLSGPRRSSGTSWTRRRLMKLSFVPQTSGIDWCWNWWPGAAWESVKSWTWHRRISKREAWSSRIPKVVEPRRRFIFREK